MAAFARVARQITGCSPTTSYIAELLDERRAVMGMEMVMTCSRKGPQTQFAPELGRDYGVTGKGGKVDGFPSSGKSVVY